MGMKQATVERPVIRSADSVTKDDDIFNRIRRTLWPKLHGLLKRVGGYSLGIVNEAQFVGYINEPEERVEDILVSAGFKTNPIAALKRRFGRSDVSDGSWVYRSADGLRPDFLAPMQLHVTLFKQSDSVWAVYAHWEDNFWVSPFKHLNASNFNPEKGVEKARKILSDDIEIVEDAPEQT